MNKKKLVSTSALLIVAMLTVVGVAYAATWFDQEDLESGEVTLYGDGSWEGLVDKYILLDAEDEGFTGEIEDGGQEDDFDVYLCILDVSEGMWFRIYIRESDDTIICFDSVVYAEVDEGEWNHYDCNGAGSPTPAKVQIELQEDDEHAQFDGLVVLTDGDSGAPSGTCQFIK